MRFYYVRKMMHHDADDRHSFTDETRCWGVARMINVDSSSEEDEGLWLLEESELLTKAEADEKVAQLNKTLDESQPPFTAADRYQWEINRYVEVGTTCGKLKSEIERLQSEAHTLQRRLILMNLWMERKFRQLYPDTAE